MTKLKTLHAARVISYKAYLKALKTPLNTRNVSSTARIFENINARIHRHEARIHSIDCFIVKPTTEVSSNTNHRQRLAHAVERQS